MDTTNRIHLIFLHVGWKFSDNRIGGKTFWKMHCFFFSFIRCCQLPLKPYLFRSFPNPTIQGSFGISCHERLHLVKREWGNMIELLLHRIVLLYSSVFLNILIVLQTSKTFLQHITFHLWLSSPKSNLPLFKDDFLNRDGIVYKECLCCLPHNQNTSNYVAKYLTNF